MSPPWSASASRPAATWSPRLVADDLFDANRRLTVPPLALRVGLVASAGSDGHRDLVRQLDASGFAFHVVLRSVRVEGPTAPKEIRAALATFGPGDVDVAMLVRGGGAKASLDVFDQGAVAHAIATSAVPVWTGIGHTGDRSVADEVANRSFPTPTAAGQALVVAAAEAWSDVTSAVARIARLVDARLTAAGTGLDDRRRSVTRLARHQLELREHAHARTSVDLRRSAGRGLDLRTSHLAMTAHHLRVSGGAELRDAGRRLAVMAADTTEAVTLRCKDAAYDLAGAAAAAATGATAALDESRRPFQRAHAALAPARFDRLLDAQAAVVTASAQRAGREVRRRLESDADRTASRRAVLEAYDPHRQLARGWTLTRTADGRLVRRAADVAPGLALAHHVRRRRGDVDGHPRGPPRPRPGGHRPMSDTAPDKLTYAQAVEELNGIIGELDEGLVDVDALTVRFQRAIDIMEDLDGRIRRARAKVEELAPRLEALSGAAGDSAPAAPPGPPDYGDEPF